MQILASYVTFRLICIQTYPKYLNEIGDHGWMNNFVGKHHPYKKRMYEKCTGITENIRVRTENIQVRTENIQV